MLDQSVWHEYNIFRQYFFLEPDLETCEVISIAIRLGQNVGTLFTSVLLFASKEPVDTYEFDKSLDDMKVLKKSERCYTSAVNLN